MMQCLNLTIVYQSIVVGVHMCYDHHNLSLFVLLIPNVYLLLSLFQYFFNWSTHVLLICKITQNSSVKSCGHPDLRTIAVCGSMDQ